MSKARFLSASQQHQLRVIKEHKAVDREWYYSRYRDVFSLEIDPAEHYVWLGADLGRDPSPDFSTRFYLEEYPDVAADGVNPLYHYLTSGRESGRHPLPLAGQSVERSRRAGPIQYRIDRLASMQSDEDWLLFVAYSPDGRLSVCQKEQIGEFSKAGYRVALIVNSGDFANLVDPGDTPAKIQIVRENVGFDFGAWRHATELLGGLSAVRSVSLTNDSIMPVGGSKAIKAFKKRVDEARPPVLFMTDNLEVQKHSQSYFIRLAESALDAGALTIFTETPYHADKDELIHQVEIKLADRMRDAGHDVGTLFAIEGTERNPTIHHWEELIDLGLPFLKVQLFTAGILDFRDPRLAARLDERQIRLLEEHCQGRGAACSPWAVNRNVPAPAAIPAVGRFNEYGAQQAWNLPACQNPTIQVPLTGIANELSKPPRILAIIHGFYTDVCRSLLEQIAEIAIPMRVVITTDSASKSETIQGDLAELGLTGEVVIAENRGRDVAPFLIEGASFARDADVILHLHTKRSPHDPVYAGWAPFLFKNLIGSREVVLSILAILDQPSVGMVYSDHYTPVVGLRNWGFDFERAQQLLARAGLQIGADDVLEFPTSTMFWARREALQPLFDLNLRYEDFEEEAGQIDGTLAHAIERSLLFVTQSVGLSHAKVTTEDQPNEAGSPLLRLAAGDLDYALSRPIRYLPGDSTVRSEFYSAVPEVYPVPVARSRSKRPRLTALLPTMQPAKIYGGITTALHVIGDILSQMPKDQHLRVLITSDHVDAASVAELSRRLGRNFTLAMPDDDAEGDTIVGVAENQHVPISLRRGELYVATAWWTADLGFRLIDRQQEMHGTRSKMVYIIQDFEPGFYNWSNTYSLAEATYHRAADTIGIINSEELTRYLCGRYEFAQAHCVPYKLNARLAELIEPAAPEPMILVYGRPSVSRNCFELLREGLRIWQARDPRKNDEYEIVFAGEEFDPKLIAGLANARNAGKMSLEEYADHLRRAAVGISLMVSPHPSYPPLEMASAGLITITNAYEGKDLEERAPNIISVKALTPADLAASIDTALSKVVYGVPKQTNGVGRLELAVPEANYQDIARSMLEALEDRNPEWRLSIRNSGICR